MAGLVCAFAVVWAGGALVGSVPYPPLAIAALIVRATPGEVSTAAIELLGHWAMRLLAVGVHVAAFGAAAWAGAVIGAPETPRARARRALAWAGAFFLAATLLGFASPQGSSALAPLVYGAAALVFARVACGTRLSRALEPELRQGETPLDSIRRSRRRFLTRLAAGLGGFLVGAVFTARLSLRQQGPSVAIPPARDPFVPPPPDPDFPAVAGLVSEITRPSAFYTVDINLLKPSVDHATWRLKVHGLMDKPYDLAFGTLGEGFEVVEMAHTLTCISNEVGGDLISTAVWRGVRLRDVLARGGLRPGAVKVVFRAADGYSDSIPIAKALEDTTLVVFGMNGRALPRRHGFPARIIVPGIYGMKNVKWLTEIEAVSYDYQGYWMKRGWSDRAVVKTESRIDVPAHEVAAVGSYLAGIAWAGDRGVRRVEVSEDGGRTWHEARLKRELAPLAWRMWSSEIGPGPSRRKVLVRAVDGEGTVQDARRSSPHPAGASGYDGIDLNVSGSGGG